LASLEQLSTPYDVGVGADSLAHWRADVTRLGTTAAPATIATAIRRGRYSRKTAVASAANGASDLSVA